MRTFSGQSPDHLSFYALTDHLFPLVPLPGRSLTKFQPSASPMVFRTALKSLQPETWKDGGTSIVMSTPELLHGQTQTYMYMLHFNILLQNFLILNSSKRPQFDPWVKKILWRKEWQPTPVLLPEESHGQRSLSGYSPWGLKESNTTEQLSLLTFLPTSVLLWPHSHFGLPMWWAFVLVPCCSKGFHEMCFNITHPKSWSSQVALVLKNLHASAGDVRDMVQSLGQEAPLEEGMSTYSGILVWRIPWTEEPGGL